MPVKQRQLYTECSGEITGNQETWMVLSVCKFVLGRKQNNQNCFSLPVPLQLGKRFWAWLLMGQSVHKIAGLFMGETPLNPFTDFIWRKQCMDGREYGCFFYLSDLFLKLCWLITWLSFSGKMKIINDFKNYFSLHYFFVVAVLLLFFLALLFCCLVFPVFFPIRMLFMEAFD